MLRQLGNIFVVKPEILRSILSEGYLARLEPNVLYPYLVKREDFKSAQLERKLGISANGGASSSSNTGNHREQKSNQRRSLFVNDNKALKEMMKSYSNNKDFLSSFNLS